MPTATSLTDSTVRHTNMTSPKGSPTSRGSNRAMMVLRIPGPTEAEQGGEDSERKKEGAALLKAGTNRVCTPPDERDVTDTKCVLSDPLPRHRKGHRYDSGERHNSHSHHTDKKTAPCGDSGDDSDTTKNTLVNAVVQHADEKKISPCADSQRNSVQSGESGSEMNAQSQSVDKATTADNRSSNKDTSHSSASSDSKAVSENGDSCVHGCDSDTAFKPSDSSASVSSVFDDSSSKQSASTESSTTSTARKTEAVSSQPEIVPALKRKDSVKNRSLNRTVSVTEPQDKTISEQQNEPGKSALSASDNGEDTDATPAVPNLSKRRISFPADSVLTAVIQDGDTAELVRILTGRHGPGLVSGGGGRGVDVCASNHVGLTALHHAVLANNLDAAKLLLAHGADVNAQDVHGFSPLHTAAACGFLPFTSFLLLFGADVFSLTSECELPVDVARDVEVIRVLTSEMTRQVHQELWLTSLLRSRLEEGWVIVRKVLACVLLFMVYIFMFAKSLWRRHRKKD
ncbi:apoptotic enhancer 1 protein-like [Littorina saxatilis]|uniref:Uncharacterized protein n=1 Tax=Littorina saxatilis TaxID=31220 RepID=A0AAN9BH44_9CAEN